MHSFEVHSNESAYRKSDRLGLEQVLKKVHPDMVFPSYISLFRLHIM